MKNWFNQLSLQRKIGSIFSLILLVAGLSIAADMYTIIFIRSQNFQMLRTFEKAQKSYQAQAALQKVQLAEKSYTLTGDDRWLSAHAGAAGQIAAYLRQATFEAGSDEERKILLEVKQAWDAYLLHFQQMTAALPASQQDQSQAKRELMEKDTAKMYDGLDRIGNQAIQAYQQLGSQINFFILITVIVTITALLLFSGSAILATRVLNQRLVRPVQLVRQAVGDLKQGRFNPASLRQLEESPDEIGRMVHEFIQMADAVELQEANLQQQAEEIRARIR